MSNEVITSWLEAQAERGHVPSKVLLAEGCPFVGAALPKRFRQGPQKQCYGNAGNMASRHPSTMAYVEGYAMVPGLFPMPHAWCLDKATGLVVDSTWDNPESCHYMGIIVDTKFMLKIVRETGVWGLFDTRLFWERLSQEERTAVFRSPLKAA